MPKRKPPPRQPRDDCTHRWSIQPPTVGVVSRGICVRCGGIREFQNHHTLDLNEKPARRNNSDLFGGRR